MKFEELIVLLPCHSLEDFPVHSEGSEAAGLLSAWSALWHPALLAEAGRLPSWFRADGPPDTLAGRLIIVPGASESLLLAGWVSRARSEGAHVLRKIDDRAALVTAALAALDDGGPAVEPGLAEDFLALGTCYLLVELLTRQMRYMSNIDEVHLQNETVAAARLAVAGDNDAARDRLRQCFDVLVEARERFYPVNAYLVDLILVAPSTLGSPLAEELAGDWPKNLLISGETLEQWTRDDPESAAVLRLALEHKTADVVGGDYRETESSLELPETVLSQIEHGLRSYRRLLGHTPQVYARRRFGLSPLLPQVLTNLGFAGALHFTLDDGTFPQCDQAKTRWEGWDSSAIDALCRVPQDASLPETMLGFSRKMGESMDLDHVATIVFAHWPGKASVFFGDLRRMSRYAPALGRFITLSEYFATTDRPGELTKFKADQYRSPHLRQAVIRDQADPISTHLRSAAKRLAAEAIHTLDTWAGLLSPAEATDGCRRASVDELLEKEDALVIAARQEAHARLARSLGFEPGREALLVTNQAPFRRQVLIDVSSLAQPPAVDGPVLGVQKMSGGQALARVEVPGCGFVRIEPGQTAPAPAPSKPPRPLAEGNVLRNEWIELTVHPETGGIRSIHVAQHRGNRLSQQLAFRLPPTRAETGQVWHDPEDDTQYSEMIAESIEMASAGPLVGRIVSRGRLVDAQGRRLADFTQTVQLCRGSRVVEIDVELDVAELPRADAWNSYYAARFAWADPTTELRRSAGLSSHVTAARRIEAPQYIQLEVERARTTIFTGGLPFHRRQGDRMLDTLLVVRGETARRFRLGLGIDLPNPTQEAVGWMDPPIVSAVGSGQAASGWLFHFDTRNVVATHWHAVCREGRAEGFRVRLLETEGRAGRTNLRLFRAPQVARQVDFQGQPLVDLPLERDTIGVDLGAYDWIEIEALWESPESLGESAPPTL